MMKCPNCKEEIDKFSDICPKCRIDIFEFEKNAREENANNNRLEEPLSSNKTIFLKWINILQLIGFIIAGFISFSIDGGETQGVIYIAIGLITCAFIKGFSDIINLLDSINNKLGNNKV